MIGFFIVIFLLIVVPDIILCLSALTHVPRIWSLVLVVPTVFMLALMLCGQHFGGWAMKAVFLLVFCWSIPKLMFVLTYGLGHFGALLFHFHQKNIVQVSALVSAIAFAATFYGCFFGWKKLNVVERTFVYPSLPKNFDSYRIVHLSDLHLGTYSGDVSFVSKVVDSVNSLRPDLIVFTGDLVNSASDEIIPFADVLSRLKARDGVLSVLGNHDYCVYRRYVSKKEAIEELERVKAMERKLGWNLLVNENHVIHRGSDSLAVIGVENAGAPPFKDYSDLQGALRGVENSSFSILLSHDPTHWRREVLGKTKIDLMLAGHTHAAQFKVGSFSPSKWTYSEWGGPYKEKGKFLNVSLGIGGSVPFRIGAWPEIDVIVLKRQE